MTAQQLRDLRATTGLSQEKFAEYIGVNYHSLREYERSGRAIPRVTGEFIELKVTTLIARADQEEERLIHELHQSATKRK